MYERVPRQKKGRSKEQKEATIPVPPFNKIRAEPNKPRGDTARFWKNKGKKK